MPIADIFSVVWIMIQKVNENVSVAKESIVASNKRMKLKKI